MRLDKLVTQNVLGAPDGTFVFEHDLVSVVGNAASGKTSLLRAIVLAKELVGAYGLPREPSTMLRRGASRARLVAVWRFTPRECSEFQLAGADHEVVFEVPEPGQSEYYSPLCPAFSRYDLTGSLGKLELFGAERRLSPGPYRPLSVSAQNVSDHLEPTTSKYAGFEHALLNAWLEETVAGVPGRFSLFKKAVVDLAPGLQLRSVEVVEGQPRVWFRTQGREVELYELSQTEQQAVLFAIFFTQWQVRNSVILLDAPEISAPEDPSTFLGRLQRFDGNNQFIVASSVDLGKGLTISLPRSAGSADLGRVSASAGASETSGASDQASSATVPVATKAPPIAGTRTRELDVRQFAYIAVEAESTPLQQVCDGFGLSAAEWEQEVQRWNAIFQEQQQTYGEFCQLVAYYRAVRNAPHAAG